MKKLVIAVLGILMLASCKKERTGTPVTQEPAFKKITGIVSNFGETTGITYDANGRVIAVNEEGTLFSFDYSQAGKVIVKEKSVSGNVTTSFVTVNAKGNATSIQKQNPDGSAGKQSTYTYNTDGYLVKAAYSNGGGTSYYEYEYENGNYTVQKYYVNNVLTNTERLTYDVTKTNTAGWDLANDLSSYSNLFGKRNKNPWLTVMNYDKNGALLSNNKFIHEADANGYVTKTTKTNAVTGNLLWWETYTY